MTFFKCLNTRVEKEGGIIEMMRVVLFVQQLTVIPS
jgi:hypothetical protein